MGFGRGKGFTSKLRTLMTTFVAKVNGKASITLTSTNPTYEVSVS